MDTVPHFLICISSLTRFDILACLKDLLEASARIWASSNICSGFWISKKECSTVVADASQHLQNILEISCVIYGPCELDVAKVTWTFDIRAAAGSTGSISVRGSQPWILYSSSLRLLVPIQQLLAANLRYRHPLDLGIAEDPEPDRSCFPCCFTCDSHGLSCSTWWHLLLVNYFVIELN